jgi:uncharacterized protein (TIGR02246 family)
MLRNFFLLASLSILIGWSATAQENKTKAIYHLIDNYSVARENRDTVLLKKILTADVDQLVSTGEWRYGIQSAVKGMLESSATSPGTRTLRVERVRFLGKHIALADARYDIRNDDGTIRSMWSSFAVVKQGGTWKISAIRNMLPAKR